MAPWNTIAASVQRTARSRPGRMVRTSSSSSSTLPEVLVPGGSRRRTAAARVDLPQPDSPARPRVSPGSRVRLTPRTADTSPALAG
jgi:hypothetical protein